MAGPVEGSDTGVPDGSDTEHPCFDKARKRQARSHRDCKARYKDPSTCACLSSPSEKISTGVKIPAILKSFRPALYLAQTNRKCFRATARLFSGHLLFPRDHFKTPPGRPLTKGGK